LGSICCHAVATCLGKIKHLGVKGAPHRSTLAYANKQVVKSEKDSSFPGWCVIPSKVTQVVLWLFIQIERARVGLWMPKNNLPLVDSVCCYGKN